MCLGRAESGKTAFKLKHEKAAISRSIAADWARPFTDRYGYCYGPNFLRRAPIGTKVGLSYIAVAYGGPAAQTSRPQLAKKLMGTLLLLRNT